LSGHADQARADGSVLAAFLLLLSCFFSARLGVVLSLLLPIAVGVVFEILFGIGVIPLQWFLAGFGTVNFRMVALPSIALDVYSDFFSSNSLTHFGRVSFLKPFMACPYTDPLSVVIFNCYQLGYLNASLFTTEGIASVGPVLAPLSALICDRDRQSFCRSASQVRAAVRRHPAAGLPEHPADDEPLTKQRRHSVPLWHGMAWQGMACRARSSRYESKGDVAFFT
jgi:hypothetical protein